MSEEFEPSNKRARFSAIISTSETMSSSEQPSPTSRPVISSGSSSSNSSDAVNGLPNTTTAAAVNHNILNHDNKPSPRDMTEFLENPTMFHPSKEFIDSTFIDVSIICLLLSALLFLIDSS